MCTHLSREVISSFAGAVLPLSLVDEGVDRHSEVSWSVEGEAAAIRGFEGEGEYSFKNGVLVTLVRTGEATVRASLVYIPQHRRRELHRV